MAGELANKPRVQETYLGSFNLEGSDKKISRKLTVDSETGRKWRLRPRKRIALLLPSSNTVMEADFWSRLPENITLHVARMYFTEATLLAERRMIINYMPIAVKNLKTLHPDLVIFGCTSGAMLYKHLYGLNLEDKLSKEFGCPVLTVPSAIREGLKDLGVKRIAVFTPYVKEINEMVFKDLVAQGYMVSGINGMGVEDNLSMGMIEPEQILEFIIESIDHLEYEAVFLSCTNFRSYDVRDKLEKIIKKPVFVSNQAVFEKALKVIETNVGK